MRPVLAGDVFALAHALQRLSGPAHQTTCMRWLQEADWADKYRKRFGVLHPVWGNGSLMGRIGAQSCTITACPAFQSAEFCASLASVLVVLDHWRCFKAHRSGRAILPSDFKKSEFPP